MDFPDVIELLEYWNEYPPAHLLLRALCHFDGKSKTTTAPSKREKRAVEIGDEGYKPEPEKQKAGISTNDASRMIGMMGVSVKPVKHMDCAPGHIQEAIARAKRNVQFDIPPPPNE
jgi:hypothetical protein